MPGSTSFCVRSRHTAITIASTPRSTCIIRSNRWFYCQNWWTVFLKSINFFPDSWTFFENRELSSYSVNFFGCTNSFLKSLFFSTWTFSNLWLFFNSQIVLDLFVDFFLMSERPIVFTSKWWYFFLRTSKVSLALDFGMLGSCGSWSGFWHVGLAMKTQVHTYI